jgi:hypothetical protein
MIGFNPPTNFIDDPEALLKRTKAKLKRLSALELEDNRIRQSLTPKFEAMANKSLREFSSPTTANIRTGPEVNVGENRFELKPALINMVQASQFSRKAHEDTSAYLQHFLEFYNTFTIKEVTKDAILLLLFPFLLSEKAKQWFYANKDKNGISAPPSS